MRCFEARGRAARAPFIVLLFVLLLPLWLRAQAPAGPLSQLQVPQAPVDVSSPVTASAVFDPPAVRSGEKAFYRITIDAAQSSIHWPGTVSAPPELKFNPVAHGQLIQNLGNRFRPLSSFLYEVQTTAAGHFTVPGFVVEVDGQPIQIPAAVLDVDKSASSPPPRQLLLDVSTTNVFPGQPFDVRMLSPASAGNEVETLREIQFNGEGFIVDATKARQAIQMTPLKDGRVVPAYIFETTLTPIAPGTIKFSVQGFTAGREFIGPITISGQVVLRGGPPQYTLLVSDPVRVNVRPLPTAGKLPGFTGAVGKFTLDPPQLSTNRIHVGEPVQLTVNVHAEGDSGQLVPPAPPLLKDWDIFLNPSSGLSYTLIPLTDKAQKTPVIPFSYFDPETGKYVDLTIPSVPVAVTTEGLPTELSAMDAEMTSGPPLKLNDLSPTPGKTAASLRPLQLRSWFVCVQIVPVLGFFGLWQWDRRRRFLETHPEIVRRRRARRALRREKRRLQQAVAGNDSTAFVRHSVNAMKIACAPHYSAHPQALVCAEVMERLDDAERNGAAGETVRKIFAAADARFASATQPQNDWLALQPEVNAVLLKLEDRL